MRIPAVPVSLLGLTAVLAGSGSAAAQCSYSADRNATVNASGASLVRIEAVAGSLRVEGQSGLTSVEVEGHACAAREDDLDGIVVHAGRMGTTVTITAIIPDRSARSWFGSSPRLDLVVRVPQTLPLEITDGSGDTEIRNVAALTVRDGSGGLEIENVAGDLHLDDGSGSVRVRTVQGSVIVDEDGSGELDLEDVRGSVRIESDGSGGIEARNVGGDVVIGRDSSGGIAVDGVSGDLRVDRDSSGGIHYASVRGQVDIPRRRR
jgi:hypothetical protein